MVKENYSLEKTLVRSSVLGWTKREVRVGGGVGVGWRCSIFEKVMISANEQLQPGKTARSSNFGVLDQEFWLPLMMKLLEHQTWMRKTDLALTYYLAQTAYPIAFLWRINHQVSVLTRFAEIAHLKLIVEEGFGSKFRWRIILCKISILKSWLERLIK